MYKQTVQGFAIIQRYLGSISSMKVQKGKKQPRKMKKRTHITVPVLMKKRGRYTYSPEVLRWANRAIKRKEKQSRKTFEEIKDVKTFQESELLQQQSACEQIQDNTGLQQPFLVTNVQPFEWKMPKQLDVAFHQGTRIEYSGDILYYRIATKDVLQRLCMKKKLKINLSVPQLELTQEEYSVPPIVKKYLKKLHKVNFWLYSGNRQTQWHYDGHDNFLFVLSGKKIVYLSEPESIQSNNAFSLFNNHIKEDKIRKIVKVKRAIVKQGSCVFIPRGWWHKVYSFGQPNSAINFWGNSISEILESLTHSQKSIVLKSLLFQLSDNFCKHRIQNWNTFSQEKMRICRELSAKNLLTGVDWQWEQRQ